MLYHSLYNNLQKELRESDFVARYGGEEFSVILIDTPSDNAMILAERLRKRIEALTVKYDDQVIKFKISIGVAELDKEVTEYQAWLERADKALYYSKENGRNQSTLYDKEKIDELKDVG